HVVVLMLENRSFDNLLGWLYEGQGNVPPHNVPAPPSGQQPYYLGLEAQKYWNTNPASAHDTAPASDRYYAEKIKSGYTVPDPNPREVFPSFVEQMFGTESPSATQDPDMSGFVQNYAGLKKNPNPGAVMETYTPTQVPAISKLGTGFAVCDRWFGSLPSETWPNRSFVHAGTSFGRLNNCDGKYTENCVPNFTVYAGKRTIFDVLADRDVRWEVYQNAAVVGTLVSAQFWTVPQKLKWHAYHLSRLAGDLEEVRAPQYVFIEPSYAVKANDQHPPHDVLLGDHLIDKVYAILRASSVWHKTLLIVTHDEHGGCYDHVPPPKTAAPDSFKPQFEIGGMNPFERLGPRVPALVASPYVKAGTVFRAPAGGAEYDHTSILASLFDWVGLSRDSLGSNARIQAAPTVWPALTLDVGRTDCLKALGVATADDHDERAAAEAAIVQVDHRKLVILAMGEADRILAEEAAGGVECSDEEWTERYERVVQEKLGELEELRRRGELEAFLKGLAGE
ncbi:MAG TPA: alkaline phosphatase family protein, partial [Gemmatimonadota bacterium]|nr:alkaline phosphatase family protein [Gemmatimonadota bacterium]